MSTEQSLVCITLLAGEDLSAKQYRAVKLSAANTIVAASAETDLVIGVLQNDPTSGQSATVAIGGVTKMVLGGTVGYGVRVTPDSAGDAVAASTSSKTFGMALDGGSDNDISRVLLTLNGHELPA